MIPASTFRLAFASMNLGIAQTLWLTSATRHTWTMTIGLLLIVVSMCNSLANGHDHANQVLGHETVSHALDAHLPEPCHALKASPLTEPSVDSPPNNQELAGFPTGSWLQPLALSRLPLPRNEQWCSDPSVHLVNCVFLN